MEATEELDLEMLVRRLKHDNALLRQEILLLRSGAACGDSPSDGSGLAAAEGTSGRADERVELSEGEEAQLRRQVLEWLEDPSPEARLNVQPSMFFIHAAFGLLRGLLSGKGTQAAAGQSQQAGGLGGQEVVRLRLLVQEQEQQVAVLAGLLRKQGLARCKPADRAAAGGASGEPAAAGELLPERSSSSLNPQPGSGQPTRPPPASNPTSLDAEAAEAAPAALYSDALLSDQQKAVWGALRGCYVLLWMGACTPPLSSGAKNRHAWVPHMLPLLPLLARRSV